MNRYNQKHKDEEEHILIGWLIVVFSIVILYLIWHLHGYI